MPKVNFAVRPVQRKLPGQRLKVRHPPVSTGGFLRLGLGALPPVVGEQLFLPNVVVGRTGG